MCEIQYIEYGKWLFKVISKNNMGFRVDYVGCLQRIFGVAVAHFGVVSSEELRSGIVYTELYELLCGVV